MARGNMLLGYARGKMGSIVFKRQNGQQVEVPYNPSPRNARTRAQVKQRTQLSNLVSMYRAGIALLNHSFTDKPSNRSSYNAFVAANLNKVQVFIPKAMAESKGCVVAPYFISSGNLPAIQISGVGANAITNIAVGDLVINEQTTIGQFAAALVANNANIEYGMQLSYVSAVQSTNAQTGYPEVAFGLYEITLSADNNELVSIYLPVQATNVVDGFLAHGALVAEGGFAWIMSKKTAEGKLVASPQRLIVTSSDLYSQYSGGAAATRAIDSYGANSEAFLDPGSNSASGSSSAVQVASAKFDGSDLIAGSGAKSLGASGSEHTIVIVGSNLSNISAVNVQLTATDNSGENTQTANLVGSEVEATDNTVVFKIATPAVVASKQLHGLRLSFTPSGSYSWTGTKPTGGDDELDPLG